MNTQTTYKQVNDQTYIIEDQMYPSGYRAFNVAYCDQYGVKIQNSPVSTMEACRVQSSGIDWTPAIRTEVSSATTRQSDLATPRQIRFLGRLLAQYGSYWSEGREVNKLTKSEASRMIEMILLQNEG